MSRLESAEEKRWNRLQQRLFAESRGDDPVQLSSQRTLFGIKSHVEQVIERTAAEDEARCTRKITDEDPDESDNPTGACNMTE